MVNFILRDELRNWLADGEDLLSCDTIKGYLYVFHPMVHKAIFIFPFMLYQSIVANTPAKILPRIVYLPNKAMISAQNTISMSRANVQSIDLLHIGSTFSLIADLLD